MTQGIPITVTKRHVQLTNGITHHKQFIVTFTIIPKIIITYPPLQVALLIATII
jgi:hypothetical protein